MRGLKAPSVHTRGRSPLLKPLRRWACRRMVRKAHEIEAVLDAYHIGEPFIPHPVYPGSQVTRYGLAMEIAVHLYPRTERLT